MTAEEEFIHDLIIWSQSLPTSWVLPIVALATLLLAWLSWTRLPGANAGSPNIRFWAIVVLALHLSAIILLPG